MDSSGAARRFLRWLHDPDFKLVELLLASGADPSYAGSTGQFAGQTALQSLKVRRNQADARSKDSNYHVNRRNDEAAHVKKMDELIQLLEGQELVDITT